MTHSPPDSSDILARALAEVDRFSDKNIAVLPERPCEEMLKYIAHTTGEDVDKLRRLYELFLATGRLDSFGSNSLPPSAGFAES